MRALPALAQGAVHRARSVVFRRRAVARRTHAESWKEPGVAGQMAALVATQIDCPEEVDPLRTFLQVSDVLAADPALGTPIRFLEHGCGVGHYAELLERRHPGRFAYTGADYSPAMVEVARRERPSGTFVVDDLLDTALNLGAFDVVCASALVDVLPEWRRPLEILLAARAPIVFLHRQRVTAGRSRIELAPGYRGQRTYATYVSLPDLERLARTTGRTIAATYEVSGPVHSFLLRREP